VKSTGFSKGFAVSGPAKPLESSNQLGDPGSAEEAQKHNNFQNVLDAPPAWISPQLVLFPPAASQLGKGGIG
jgi:hypothetical protein